MGGSLGVRNDAPCPGAMRERLAAVGAEATICPARRQKRTRSRSQQPRDVDLDTPAGKRLTEARRDAKQFVLTALDVAPALAAEPEDQEQLVADQPVILHR